MRISGLILAFLAFTLVAYSQPCTPNTNSLSFSASSVDFTTDTNLGPDSAITVEAWIRASSFGINNYDNSIVCKHSWSAGEQGYVLRCGNGQADFTVCGKDNTGASISWVSATSPTSSMTTNTWYHVAGTYDGDSVRVYINGVQKAATSLPDGMIAGLAYPIKIGRLSDQGQSQTRYFSGLIDEVRIWDRALTATEILSRYNKHIDPALQTGLVGYWRFNDGSGTTVTDLSTSGNNGTTSGATWSTTVPFNQNISTPIIFPSGGALPCYPFAPFYQWNLNGNPITNATGQSWTPTANGAYTVVVTDSNGCSATSAVYNMTNVGLNELQTLQLEFLNENDQLILRKTDGKEIGKIEIFNNALQNIYTQERTGSQFTWSKQHLSSGIYRLVITTTEGKRISLPFLGL